MCLEERKFCVATIRCQGLLISAEILLMQEEERDVLRGTRTLIVGELCPSATLFIAWINLSRMTIMTCSCAPCGASTLFYLIGSMVLFHF